MKKWTYKTNESMYLKTRLSSYPYIVDMIQRCNDEICAIDLKLAGFKSSSNYPLSGVPNDGGSKNEELKYELMDKRIPWEKKLNKYQEELNELNMFIESIDNETEREFIKDVYINCKSNGYLANKYKFSDFTYVYHKINWILKKVAKKIF